MCVQEWAAECLCLEVYVMQSGRCDDLAAGSGVWFVCYFWSLRACLCVWGQGRVWDQTCPLMSYTNLRRTNSKWHLNWSRWKALWTGSKGWYFHAGVKTNLLAYTPSSFSFFLTHIYTHARPQHEVESVGLAAFLQICKASYLTGFLVYQFS